MQCTERYRTTKADVGCAEKQRQATAESTRGLRGKVRVECATPNFSQWLLQSEEIVTVLDMFDRCVDPFPNVADQLLNAIGSRAIGVILDRDGLPMAGAANVRPIWFKTIAPREPNLRLPPDTRSLPLGGSGQCFACPGSIRVGFVPTDTGDRVIRLFARRSSITPTTRPYIYTLSKKTIFALCCLQALIIFCITIGQLVFQTFEL